MPIYEIICRNCGKTNEVIITGGEEMSCPSCGSGDTEKLMSATSPLTGRSGQPMPGRKDTTCCGNSPAGAGCAGPGSCCGRMG